MRMRDAPACDALTRTAHGDACARAEPAHAARLLAAGASTRLGDARQLIEINGEPLLRRAARALLATTPHELVVVLGHQVDHMRETIADLPLRIVIATDCAEGMSASLRAGIVALDPVGAGALVALTDQPALDAAHLIALRDAWREAPAHAIASAYANVLGVPALLPRAWFADLAQRLISPRPDPLPAGERRQT